MEDWTVCVDSGEEAACEGTVGGRAMWGSPSRLPTLTLQLRLSSSLSAPASGSPLVGLHLQALASRSALHALISGQCAGLQDALQRTPVRSSCR